MGKLLVLHGPNLNLLGDREPDVYGKTNLASLNQSLTDLAKAEGHELDCFQSNAEHELVNRIHQAKTDPVDFIVINPAAFTHTSIAVRDALLAVDIPFIEVHLSNIYQRETFRQHSYFSDIALGVISGLGTQSYTLAVQSAFSQIKQ